MQHMAMRTILLILMVFFAKDFSCAVAYDYGFSFPEYDGGAEEDNSCTTNSGGQGTCVSFSKCPTISMANFFSIRPKICGWEGIDQIICCPLQSPSPPLEKAPPPKPTPITTTTTTTTTTVSSSWLADIIQLTIPTPVKKCQSGHDCLNYNICEAMMGNNMPSFLHVCGMPPKDRNKMVCCPKKDERSVNRSECATFENIQSGIRAKRGNLLGVAFGEDAKKGSWPWMAAIFFNESLSRKSPFCGGSLISSNTVLTAAHCFMNTDATSKFVVLLGDLKLGDNSDGLTPVEVDVSRVISHEGYKYPSVYNDIAILKLATTVNFTPNIRMICLPDVRFRNFKLEDKNATITGWGHFSFSGKSSPALQEAIVPIVHNSQCDQVYKTIIGAHNDQLPNGVTKNIICAGNDIDKKDACQGDSGGPLVYRQKVHKRWILIGIIASGFECGRGIPGLYTRVTEYLDWIGSHN